MIRIVFLYNYLFISFICILNIYHIQCMIIRKTSTNHLFPIDIMYKRSNENEIKSVQCTRINRKNIKGSIYACIQEKEKIDIDHSIKIKERPSFRQQDTAYCSIFAFNDLFYAKTGLSLSNSDSAVSNYFSRQKMFFLENEPIHDIVLRNQLVAFRNIDKEFNHNDDDLNHHFDQYNTPDEILEIYQDIGNLLYVDGFSEIAMWSRVAQAFGSLYSTRKTFCDKYKQLDIEYDFKKKYMEFYEEMLSYGHGIFDLVVINDTNNKLRKQQGNEVNMVRDVARELIVTSYLLPLNDDNENKEKLNIILRHLRKTILIAAMYTSRNRKMDGPISMSKTHHILVLGYDEESRTFKIKDSLNGKGVQTIHEDTFLKDVFHISMLKKYNEIS